ncbi:branched-chain amino acid transport system II carrier protein [Jeotgalibaca sp. A122]|uniref:branched-chain amino acid transport system II carrier protein n=1 Tax=Jeotgalibaca sp. A122 TaxID=3457322 RepID=UPI003FD56A3E
MKVKDIFVVGFMLFAMFFGAGNLIFPVALGFQSGGNYWPAILGFILTGVGLPLVSVIVGSISENGYRDLLHKIHPTYSVVFLIIIYLTIGPFFAIPRTATTAYEIGVVPFLGQSTNLGLFIFSLIFFSVVLMVALSPNNLADNIGKYLTPTLLVTIILLIIRAVSMYRSNTPQPLEMETPFVVGFTEGYLTMDAIAAIAFSIVVLNAIRGTGVTDKKELFMGTIKSSFLAVVLLGFIYTGLGWAGNQMPVPAEIPANQNLGAYLIQIISNEAFGSLGILLLGVMVFLACLTTAVGLIAAVSEYFNSLLPSISYKSFAFIFSGISFVMANQGLDAVIQASVPVLGMIYPVAISTVILIAVSYFVPSSRISLQLPLIMVAIISVLSVAHQGGWLHLPILEKLPLYSIKFEWIPLLVIGYVLGQIIGFRKKKVTYNSSFY